MVIIFLILSQEEFLRCKLGKNISKVDTFENFKNKNFCI